MSKANRLLSEQGFDAITAAELRELIVCDEFKQDLEEMSSYLASIKQEQPIVYLLAKCVSVHGPRMTTVQECGRAG